MIRITQEFFTSMRDYTRSGTPNSALFTEYFGYSPPLDELALENIYDDPVEISALTNTIISTCRLLADPNKLLLHTTVDTGRLGFGPLSTDRFNYYALLQLVPYYILETFLLAKDGIFSPLYKKVLTEYHVRHELNQKYSRPLDPFIFPSALANDVSEKYYNPLSLDAYSFLSDKTDLNKPSLNFMIHRVGKIQSANMRTLKTLLLSMNKHYINRDNNRCIAVPTSSSDSVFYDYCSGADKKYLIYSILCELNKRHKEYQKLLNNPENVLFSL